MSSIVPIFAWNVPLLSLIFLKRSLVFHILLFSSISLLWSQRKTFLPLLAILWNSTFKWVYLSFSPLPFTSLLFRATCRASSDNHFDFLHFFFLGIVLIHAFCTMSRTSVHSSSGTLSDLIPWICHFHCIIVRDLMYVIPEWSSGFPTLFNLNLNLAIRSSWSEPQSAPSLVFADCIELLHLWLQRI